MSDDRTLPEKLRERASSIAERVCAGEQTALALIEQSVLGLISRPPQPTDVHLLLCTAADALDAKERRITELEKQVRAATEGRSPRGCCCTFDAADNEIIVCDHHRELGREIERLRARGSGGSGD